MKEDLKDISIIVVISIEYCGKVYCKERIFKRYLSHYHRQLYRIRKENCRGRINVIQADVSNAVTEDVVEKELECFKSLFTPDAWAAVLQTSKFLFHFICILTSSFFFK